MSDNENQDKQIMEKLCGQELTDPQILEAKYNLLGLFKVLYKIDQRLKKQAEAAGSEVSRD